MPHEITKPDVGIGSQPIHPSTLQDKNVGMVEVSKEEGESIKNSYRMNDTLVGKQLSAFASPSPSHKFLLFLLLHSLMFHTFLPHNLLQKTVNMLSHLPQMRMTLRACLYIIGQDMIR
ncbi:MAG: hypothetical protein ACR5KX_00920 [Wolbachia sp.]